METACINVDINRHAPLPYRLQAVYNNMKDKMPMSTRSHARGWNVHYISVAIPFGKVIIMIHFCRMVSARPRITIM